MDINLKTHDWSMYREDKIAGNSAVNKTSISHPSFCCLRIPWRRGERKSVRARGGGWLQRKWFLHSRAAAHFNSQRLSRHTKEPRKLKPEKFSAWRGEMAGVVWAVIIQYMFCLVLHLNFWLSRNAIFFSCFRKFSVGCFLFCFYLISPFVFDVWVFLCA